MKFRKNEAKFSIFKIAEFQTSKALNLRSKTTRGKYLTLRYQVSKHKNRILRFLRTKNLIFEFEKIRKNRGLQSTIYKFYKLYKIWAHNLPRPHQRLSGSVVSKKLYIYINWGRVGVLGVHEKTHKIYPRLGYKSRTRCTRHSKAILSILPKNTRICPCRPVFESPKITKIAKTPCDSKSQLIFWILQNRRGIRRLLSILIKLPQNLKRQKPSCNSKSALIFKMGADFESHGGFVRPGKILTLNLPPYLS